MEITVRYQIQCSEKSDRRDSSTVGMATTRMRVKEVASEGMVWPIAWNMLAVTKVRPDGTKLNDTMRRYFGFYPVATIHGPAHHTGR